MIMYNIIKNIITHKITSLLCCVFLFFNNVSAQPTEQHTSSYKAHYSLADIIEPLMSSVVNVYVTYSKQKNQKESFPHPFFDKSNPFYEFFKDFDRFLEDSYSNPQAKSLGSGFIIDEEGYVVTNHHVIQDSDEVNVKMHDGKEFPAKIIGYDSKTDLALLKINSKTKLNFVKLGNSDITRVGDEVLAIGNSFGLGGTVTRGIISSKSRDISIDSDNIINDFIQTDTSINPGNSGGPLFNLDGEVIGINTFIYSSSGGNVGIGFAIPSTKAQTIIEQLRKHGKVTRGFLGVNIQKLTDEIAENLGLKKDLGILITSVADNSNADKAGLKAGDVIIEYNNIPINDARKLQILVADTKVNTSVDVTIIRSGNRKKISVYIAEISKNSVSNDNDIIELCGVKFSNLTNSTKENFNIPKNQKEGILVQRVNYHSIWRKFLVSGDIILQVNNAPINSVNDFTWQYKQAKRNNKQNIILLLKRDRSTLFFVLPIS